MNARTQHAAAEEASKAAEEAALLARATLYAEVFGTETGRKVLDDLAGQIGFLRAVRTTESTVLHHLEGQRSVFTFILAMLRRADKEESPRISLPL